MKVFTVAAADVRTTRRLARFWAIVVIVTLFSIGAYVVSCLILGYVAPYSQSQGDITPYYLLGNIDPTFFLAFQIALAFLLFDMSHRHSRNRIEEVLDAKPNSNLECLLGRVLGVTFLMWSVVATILLALHIFGMAAHLFGFDFAQPFQLHSLLNLLLLDAPVNLVIWSSYIVFLNSILRIRLLTLTVALASMTICFLISVGAPFSLLTLFSPSSNDVLFISDLVPEFASLAIVGMRLATLFGALTLTVVAATLLKRRDKFSIPQSATLAITGSVLWIGILAISANSVLQQIAQQDHWRQVHKSVDWSTMLDIQSISGVVRIDPPKKLEIDLRLTFDVVASSSEKLVFTFNPAMNIKDLRLDGSPTSYVFQNGLLEIPTASLFDVDSTHELVVVASGVPNPRFAYFDSQVDYLTDRNASRRFVALVGTDGSVFNSQYVALMPGTYWYPIPGPVNNSYVSKEGGTDFFDVNMSVELIPKKWTLIAPGIQSGNAQPSKAVEIQTQNSVAQIALFASELEGVEMEVEDFRLAVYLHKRHSKNLHLLEGVEETIRSEWRELLLPYAQSGLNIPHEALTLVEVPNRLRIVGGGWRMDSLDALPGIVMMKERGFPTANLNIVLARLDQMDIGEGQLPEASIDAIAEYFGSGIGTDNPWKSMPRRFWSHVTSASGQYAQVLDQLIFAIISSQLRDTYEFFSVHSTLYVADRTGINLLSSVYGAESVGTFDLSGDHRRIELNYGARNSVWQLAEHNSLASLPSSNGGQQDLELLIFKCRGIARALIRENGKDKVFSWIADLRQSYAGRTYTYDNLIASAKTHDIVIDPFLTDWLQASLLPGYAASNRTTTQIRDDDNGRPQYQTTFNVRNLQPITGYVWFLSYTADEQEIPFPGVLIEGESAKQINLLTVDPPIYVEMQTDLSLNRTSVPINLDVSESKEQIDTEPAPFEQLSTWIPDVDGGIVVDDLDSGFAVDLDRRRLRRSSGIGPLSWLMGVRLEADLDYGIPTMNFYGFDGEYNSWRRFPESNAYGRYRKTLAYAFVESSPVSGTFSTTLPETSTWRLEFHFPSSWRGRWLENLTLDLQVASDAKSESVEVNAETLTGGWNHIGDFDLEEGSVEATFTSDARHIGIVLDAIRWTRIEDS